MVGKEILNDVYEYIKTHKDCNKRQIELGVSYGRLTVRDAIDELLRTDESASKISFWKDKDKPKGFYHFFINDKNEFNTLVAEIERLKSLANKMTEVVSKKVRLMKNIKRTHPASVTHDPPFRNMTHLLQAYLQFRIISLAINIRDKIASKEDRDILYLRLVEILISSGKLAEVNMPQILEGLDEMWEKFPGFEGTVWGRIQDEIIGTIKTDLKLHLP